MDLTKGLDDLVAVALVAALAPLVVALLPGPRIPQVVFFLLAGYELDPRLLRQQPGRLAIGGWVMSAAIAVGVTAGLTAAGYIRDYVPVGLALTPTALGTLLPILRDNNMLCGEFGRHEGAAGAVGEL